MKRIMFMIYLCMTITTSHAQRLSHTFDKVSFSKALVWLDKVQSQYKINFIYDELEDFTVSTSFVNKDIHDVVSQLIGFYPIHATFDKDEIYFECIQKEPRKLIGRVLDDNGEPMEFVNIALLNAKDSSYVNGGVSNRSGDFVIPVKEKQVIARFSYVGYKTLYKLVSVGSMGSIRLFRDAYTLSKVVVKAYKPLFQRKEDRIVFNVSELENIEALDVLDVLRYAPKVMVDPNGEIKVGNKGTIVYVNDRQMGGNELKAYLNSIKAKDIQTIEIKDMRGAEDDASGNNGVIRIKTKVQIGLMGGVGVNGDIVPQRNGYYQYRPQGNVTWGTEHWNIYTSVYHSQYRFNDRSETRQRFFADNTLHEAPDENALMLRKTEFYKLGGTYIIDKKCKHSIGVELNGTADHNKVYPVTVPTAFTDARQNAYDGFNTSAHRDKGEFLNGVLFYSWNINDRNSYLRLLGNYNYKHSREYNSLKSEYGAYEPLHADESNTSSSNANNGTVKVDFRYTYPSTFAVTAGGKYESSVRGNVLHEEDFLRTAQSQSSWKYNESMSAAYVGLQKNISKNFFALVSLRMESTWQKGTNRLTSEVEIDKRYTDWFPSAYVSYKLNDKAQVSLQYSRSINRPSFWDLSNYKRRTSSVLYQCGNPDLQPDYSDDVQVELAYGNHSLAYSLSYSKDRITSWFEVMDGKTYMSVRNYGALTSHDLSYYYNGKILPWWSANASMGLTYLYMPQNYRVKNKWVNAARCSNYLSFGHVGNFDISMNYTTDRISDYMIFKGYWKMDVAYNRSFLKNKLTVRIGVKDVFNTYRNIVDRVTPVLAYYFNQERYRHFYVSLNYYFNSKRKVKDSTIRNDNEIQYRL